MKWHHENVTVACLSTDEVHKAPGDPLDKLVPLKTFKNHKRKYQEHFWKLTEILQSIEKSHLLGPVRFLDKEHNAQRITAFGLVE